MKERQFSAQFRKELQKYFAAMEEPIHISLITDAPRSNKKPYDAYCVYSPYKNGKSVFAAFEFKVVNGPTLCVDILKPHQKDKLIEVAKVGGKAYVVVLAQRYKEVYLVPIAYWLQIEKSIRRMPFPDLDVPIMKRTKYHFGTMWNFEHIFTEYLDAV